MTLISPDHSLPASPVFVGELQIEVASHQGLVRDHNEDAVGVDGWTLQGDLPRSMTIRLSVDVPRRLAVCDGMGGHAGGATASALAAQQLTTPTGERADREAIEMSVQRVSDAINDVSEGSNELHGLGTTFVGAFIDVDGTTIIANIGDSRAYRLESGFLGQLTIDHRSEGNRLTQALGGGRRTILEPTFFECHLEDGGILLCSDGICDFVDDAAIEAELNLIDCPTGLPDRLVEKALAGGGGDNATAMFISLVAQANPCTNEPPADQLGVNR